MTELETISAERASLARENEELERRLGELEHEMKNVRL